MCAKLSLAFCFALSFLVAGTSQAQDVEIAVQLITQARLQLTVLGQSLAQREIDLGEKELILKSAGESLQEEWLLLTQDKLDLSEREQYLNERENAQERTVKDLATLTASYTEQSKRLQVVEASRSRWRTVSIIAWSVAALSCGALGISVLF